MIDIDEAFADAQLFDRLESNSDELFAEGLDHESSDAPLDSCDELPGISVQLQASRSTSLAIEVGIGNADRTRAEPSTNSDENRDSEQADAGPPKPNTDAKDVTKGPA
jgi:hypothetical protein